MTGLPSLFCYHEIKAVLVKVIIYHKVQFLTAALSPASCWAAISSGLQEGGCIFDQVMSFCLPLRSLTSGTPHTLQRALLLAPSKEASTMDSATWPQDL